MTTEEILAEHGDLLIVIGELVKFCGNSSKPGCGCSKCEIWRKVEELLKRREDVRQHKK